MTPRQNYSTHDLQLSIVTSAALTDMNDPAASPGPFWPETRITYLGQISSDDPVVQARAVARLCELYRTPVLKRIRSKWPLLSDEDSEDRCQQFFADEIIAPADGGLFAAFDPNVGRLRTFLGIAGASRSVAIDRLVVNTDELFTCQKNNRRNSFSILIY